MLQQLSKKFYNKIVPFCVEPIKISKSSSHAKVQESLYQYASGFLMHKELRGIVEEAHGLYDAFSKWGYNNPVNTEYQTRYKLDKSLKYGRTLYLPYNRVIVISGNDMQKDRTKPVTDVFQFHLLTNEVEKLQPIAIGRTSFAAHYDFEDRFIYVVGGCDSSERMLTDCEKFDVFNNRWSKMPSMNHERGNPGTVISGDRRYLYAFQGFVNVSSK